VFPAYPDINDRARDLAVLITDMRQKQTTSAVLASISNSVFKRSIEMHLPSVQAGILVTNLVLDGVV
jgi:hypothetical protein